MLYGLNMRRRFYLLVLFFLLLITFAAVSTNYWIQWATITAMFAVLVITDFMFLGTNEFIFDPNYQSWQVTSGTEDDL